MVVANRILLMRVAVSSTFHEALVVENRGRESAMKNKAIKLIVKVDRFRVARGVRPLPRASRFGCGKHRSRAAEKQALQREMK